MAIARLPQFLLATKITAPMPLAGWIPRTRLLALLGQSPQTRLTLIVAPAGFGKSTLVTQWLGESRGQDRAVAEPLAKPLAPLPFAWLTLDEHDQDTLRFLAYLAGAIECAAPGALPMTLDLLDTPTSSPHALIQALLFDLNALPNGLILVLDDYHQVTSVGIHQVMTYLLRHLPPRCRLVLLSRTDPQLSLTRLRIEGEVVELRAADLRFTEAETATLLEHLLGSALGGELVGWLHQYTEGWAICLQLAALAQVKAPTQDRSLRLAAREIARYLADEVLAGQPAALQQALLVLAVPDRFCAGMCAALLDRPDDPFFGESQLDQLLQASLLLIPLDSQGYWYRFHHLFRDLLLHQLHANIEQGEVRELHRRAARWLAANELAEEALRHFLLAGDEEGAGDLAELQIRGEMSRGGSNARIGYWLRLLPAELVARRPGLTLTEAHMAAVNLDVSGLQKSLERVETLLAAERAAGRPLSWPTFLTDLAALWGALHCWQGHPADAVGYLHQVLKTTAIPGLVKRSLILLGLAAVGLGQYAEEVELSEQKLSGIMAIPDSELGMALYVFRCGMHLLTGELDALYQDKRRVAEALTAGESDEAAAGYLAYCQGMAAYERSYLAAAAEHFAVVAALKHRVNYTTYISSIIGLAMIAAAKGHLNSALAYEQEALAVSREIGGAFFRHQARGCSIHLALIRGDCSSALILAQDISPDIHLGLSLWFETPRLSQAQALIAAGDETSLYRAEIIIESCLAEVESLHNIRLLILALATEALLRQAQGKADQARAALERAVALAAPRSFVRTFVDLGPSLIPLLQDLARRSPLAAYIKRVLDAYAPISSPSTQQRPTERLVVQLPEVLTPRETEILALLAKRWSDKEIAAQLVIALNTVRKHTSTIYDKLGVSSRREAVAAGQALGLLPDD